MGFDDLCGTGLVLGLGSFSASSTLEYKYSKKPANSTTTTTTNTIVKKKNICDHNNKHQPSLTLSLSGTGEITTYDHDHDHDHNNNNNNNNNNKKGGGSGFVINDHLYRQDSGVASSNFSNVVSVKRERDLGSCNEERLVTYNNSKYSTSSSRLISGGGDEEDEDDGSNGRKKLRLTKAQSGLLEESFKIHSTLNPKQKQDLARELKLRPRQVEVWFQNRRARTKLKQTEVDCEFLKKCCETLTDENRRLHKELQELKALKLAQPMYMQLPAATLTMCPSCERIGSGGADNSAKSPFIVAPKPHLFNPFSNPSAAC